jgi:hypothetical protein
MSGVLAGEIGRYFSRGGRLSKVDGPPAGKLIELDVQSFSTRYFTKSLIRMKLIRLVPPVTLVLLTNTNPLRISQDRR